MTETLTAPFPYFGGKRRAAPIIWRALGDPSGYVEPFAGSAAVLLARPEVKGRRVETLNDADGWLVNAWRAIKLSPAEVASHAAGPVTEIDYHARLAWLQERRTPELVPWLEGDPEAHDPKAAAWWLYVAACGIGDPWGKGPWRVIDGHLLNSRQRGEGDQPGGVGVNRKLPHLGDAGKGINRKLPHLGDAGQGIDPPYATSGDLYASTNHGTGHDVAQQVNEWCASPAAKGLRIVLCGYEDEHDNLLSLGWRRMTWKAGGGYGGKESDRERLWLSPACHDAEEQPGLFGEVS